MSKIKDLFAIENGDDDLVPVEEQSDDGDKVYEVLKLRMLENIDAVKEDYAQEFELETSADEEGHAEYTWDAVGKLSCIAQNYLDNYIEEQHIDITDDDYKSIYETLGYELADILEEYSEQLAKEAMDDDSDWDRLTTYNETTIIK